MKHLAKITFLFVLVLACACEQNQISKQQVKTLDSLSGSINSAIKALQKTDSSDLNKTLLVFNQYTQFINSKLNDTISKNEAIELAAFAESGEALALFQQNKINLINRLKLIDSQIQKLNSDIQLKTMNSDLIKKYLNEEIREAYKTLPLAIEQEKLYYTNYQKLKQSFFKVEEIIKSYNQQQLPTIIPNPNN